MKHQPCTFDEAVCRGWLHCWLHCHWSLISASERGRSCSCMRKNCESVCENKSVKITKSEMPSVPMVSLIPRRILTSCEVVAGVVTPYPAQCFAGVVFSQAPPHLLASTTDFTASVYIGVPTKVTMQVHSHLGTHAILSCEIFRIQNLVTVTYKCPESFIRPCIPWIAVYVTCLTTVSTSTTASSREPLEIKHKKL